MNVSFCKICLISILSGFGLFSFSQNADTVKLASRFASIVTLTTKGISTIPNLTLGKPAILFDMAMGRKLTFEPQFRFGLEGKPWTFVFWWRNKLVQSDRFSIVMVR